MLDDKSATQNVCVGGEGRGGEGRGGEGEGRGRDNISDENNMIILHI